MHDPVARARAHLAAIARGPRPAGSGADDAARRYAGDVLQGAGFAVTEQRFTYSALPGRWGTPCFGAAGMAAVLAAALSARSGSPLGALAIVAAAALGLALAGRWLARSGVLALPALRMEGVNLVATCGDGRPHVWLVAHTDSKSQPVPQAVRAAGIVLLAMALVGAGALAALEVAGWLGWNAAAWATAASIAVIGGLPVVASVVGSRSDGALDNASGLAAVLLAAELLAAGRSSAIASIGVLVTAAEELGLAGARAWAREPRVGHIALNCDGVDDVGALVGMYSNHSAGVVLEAFAAAAATSGVAYRSMRLVPGILVDAVALADAGWAAATLSRGTVRTLARVHTRHDTLEHLRGTGIPEAARVLADAAELLAMRGTT